MLSNIAFFPHNEIHFLFFKKVSHILNKKIGINIFFIREMVNKSSRDIFEYEKEIQEIWDDIDISEDNIVSIRKEYSDFALLRAIYGERHISFFPRYFNRSVISYETIQKYIVGCIIVFNRWITLQKIDCIVSELLIGVPDCILYEICKKKGIEFISIRPSKILPGVINSIPDIDAPKKLLVNYQRFLENGIPLDLSNSAKFHLADIRNKIQAPSYMESSKKDFCFFDRHKFPFLKAKFHNNRRLSNKISLWKNPIKDSFLWHFYRGYNVFRTNFTSSNVFTSGTNVKKQYFIFPLQYEPESSVLIRSFPYSNQLCVVEKIAKLLPFGVTLIVKEHRGNHGYRKLSDYKKMYYLPNVELVPRDADISQLLQKSLGVITLTSRMGWEALVLGKDVIALGQVFWKYFEKVYKPHSWQELCEIIKLIVDSKQDEKRDFEHERHLIAFAAAYISCTYDGNFVTGSKHFFTEENAQKIAEMIYSELNFRG